MNVRILMAGEADVPQLAGFARLIQRGLGAVVAIEDPVRIVETDHLVVLHQIDAVRLQASSDSSS